MAWMPRARILQQVQWSIKTALSTQPVSNRNSTVVPKVIQSAMGTSIAISSLRLAKSSKSQDNNGLMIHLYAWSKPLSLMLRTMQKMKHATRSFTMPLTRMYIVMLEMDSASWPSTYITLTEMHSLSEPSWRRTKSETLQASWPLSKSSTQSYSVDGAP